VRFAHADSLFSTSYPDHASMAHTVCDIMKTAYPELADNIDFMLQNTRAKRTAS